MYVSSDKKAACYSCRNRIGKRDPSDLMHILVSSCTRRHNHTTIANLSFPWFSFLKIIAFSCLGFLPTTERKKFLDLFKTHENWPYIANVEILNYFDFYVRNIENDP